MKGKAGVQESGGESLVAVCPDSLMSKFGSRFADPKQSIDCTTLPVLSRAHPKILFNLQYPYFSLDLAIE